MAKKNLIVVIEGDIKDFKAKMKQVADQTKNLSELLSSAGKNMSKYLTLPLVAAGGASIKFASDFNESLNKVTVAFGDSGKAVEKWAKTSLKSFGIAEGTALDMASLFGDMATSMGLVPEEAANMSTSLVKLAGDLSSFKNISIDEATTALNAIFTGETESLKRLGVVMTETNLKAFALAQGIQKDVSEMTQAEKVNLRYAYVMKMTSNAHDDFINTGGGAANQMRIFQESMKQLAAQFGQIILPLFTKIITKINSWIERFGALDEQTKKIIVVIGGIVAAVGPLLVGLGFMINTIIPALVAGGVALQAAWLPVTIVILGVVAAIALFNKRAKETQARINELANTKSLEDLGAEAEALTKKMTELKAAIREEKTAFGQQRLSTEYAEASKRLDDVNKAIELKNALQDQANEKAEEYKNILGQVKVPDLPKVEIPDLTTGDVDSHPIDKLTTNLETLKAKVLEVSGVIATALPEGFKRAADKAKVYITDLTNEITGLIVDSLSLLGNAIGEGLSGKEIGKEFIVMLADWGQRVGAIMLSAGLAIEAFKVSLSSLNGIALIIAGGALIVAASAVKGALKSGLNSGGGYSSYGSSGGGGGIGTVEGLRNLQGFEVKVTGELVARGNDLVTVFDNEQNRANL